MARVPRIVIPDLPHHVTQRGNRRQTVFFEEGDYAYYVRLLSEHCKKWQVSVWAWCLMPNHVHLVATPSSSDGLAKAIGEANRRYAWAINRRYGWIGHLWQSRFYSCVMDESHTLTAMRYVEFNPNRACLVSQADDWPWSSARAHLGVMKAQDKLTDMLATQDWIADWQDYLHDAPPKWQEDVLRKHTKTGRPLGNEKFITNLETRLGRRLRPKRRGRKNAKGNQSTVQINDQQKENL